MITNVINSDLNSSILVSHLSDHFPIFHCIKAISPSTPPKYIEARNFSKANLTSFNNSLLRFNWTCVTENNDTQLSYNNFSDSFLSLYNLYFPTTKFKFNRNYNKLEKWMSSGILTSRREKNRLSKLCFTHPNAINLAAFKNYRNLYNKIVRAAKKNGIW